jgi:hypothetical protein
MPDHISRPETLGFSPGSSFISREEEIKSAALQINGNEIEITKWYAKPDIERIYPIRSHLLLKHNRKKWFRLEKQSPTGNF